MFTNAEPITWRRKWTVVVAATLIVMASMWSIVVAVAASGSDSLDAPSPAPFAAFGLALAPFVFVAVAFGSRHRHAAGVTVGAMGLWLIVALPLGLVDTTTGLVAGFGAGGIVTLRPEPEHHWKGRAIAVLLATVYILVVIAVVPVVGIMFAPLLPLPAVAFADVFMEYRAEREAGI